MTKLLGKISGIDLVVKEAYYYRSYRRKFTRLKKRKKDRHQPSHGDTDDSDDDDELIGSSSHKQVSSEAYEHILHYVRKNIISGITVAVSIS